MWWKSPSFVSNFFMRAAIGVPLVILGIAFYRDFAPFNANVVDGLGGLVILGNIWSYLLPGLFIFSGGMLVAGRYSFVTAWTGGIALASLPIGMALKILMTNTPPEEVLNFTYPLLIWLIVFYHGVNQHPNTFIAPAEEEEDDDDD